MSRCCRPSWPTCATLLDASDIRALVSIRCPRDGGEVLTRSRQKPDPPAIIAMQVNPCKRRFLFS